jgi:hypothetical protein
MVDGGSATELVQEPIFTSKCLVPALLTGGEGVREYRRMWAMDA